MDRLYGAIVETDYGFLPLLAGEGMLRYLYLPSETYDQAMQIIAQHGNIAVESGSEVGDLDRLLVQYFEGKPVDFSQVPVDTTYATDFGMQVLRELQKLPYATIISYGQLAASCDRPGAARAVGTIMSHNRCGLVIPCHRVIAANRKIGGFAFGSNWKSRLLEIEGVQL